MTPNTAFDPKFSTTGYGIDAPSVTRNFFLFDSLNGNSLCPIFATASSLLRWATANAVRLLPKRNHALPHPIGDKE